MTAEPEHCAVAIVGGGPAGLAAAIELRRLGVGPVVVIDREPELGGIPRHCGHYPFGMREFGRLLSGPDYAARMVARARDGGADLRPATTVLGISPGPRLTLSTADGMAELTAQKVLLATGVREKSRAARMIGGSKPGGVLSTGALQGLVYLDHIRPFRRPVIVGTELVAFSALLTCRHLGISPIAMIEPGERVMAFRPAQFFPPLMGTTLMLRTELIAIHGERRVEAVTLRDASGATRMLETDGVIVSGQFLPEASMLAGSHIALDLASGGPAIDQYGRTSDPDVFAAGNLLRPVETAGWSYAEGKAAARAIATSLRSERAGGGAGTAIRVDGALKYVVPQRVVDLTEAEPMSAFQLRVTRAVRGRLTLAAAGREVWSRRLRAVPEQRITVPLSVLPPGIAAEATFSIVEDRT